MYVLPPKACTTCPWLPLIWNPRGTPVSGSSNSRLSPPLHSEQRRNIDIFCSSMLWLNKLSWIMLASTGWPKKKLLKKCWARNHTKSGSCGDKFTHGHDFGALDLITKRPKNTLLLWWLDGVFGHILQSLYWMTLKSVAIPKAETSAAGGILWNFCRWLLERSSELPVMMLQTYFGGKCSKQHRQSIHDFKEQQSHPYPLANGKWNGYISRKK